MVGVRTHTDTRDHDHPTPTTSPLTRDAMRRHRVREEVDGAGRLDRYGTLADHVEPGADAGATPADTGQTQIAARVPAQQIDMLLLADHASLTQRLLAALVDGCRHPTDPTSEVRASLRQGQTHGAVSLLTTVTVSAFASVEP